MKIGKFSVDVGTTQAEEHEMEGSRYHVTHDPSSNKVLPLVHADSLQMSIDSQFSHTTKEFEKAFVSIQMLYGGAGLYVAADAETCEILSEDLKRQAKKLREIIENKGPTNVVKQVDLDCPEDPRDLL